MIYKIGFSIMGIIAFIYGAAYLFNHVDPWLSMFVTGVGITVCVGVIVSQIRKHFKKQ